MDQQVASNLPKLSHVSLAQAVQLDLSPKASPEAGSSRCFWAGKGQPINPVADPYAVYMDVFAGIMVGTPTNMGAEDPEIKKLMNKRKSLLDYVGKNLEAFKSRLGGEDKMAIEAHHTSVRDLEKQLQSGGSAPVGAGCAPQKGTMLNLGDRLQYPNILKAQMGLAVQALKCGVTRVATLQLSDSSGNNINFGFVEGVPDSGTGLQVAVPQLPRRGPQPGVPGRRPQAHRRPLDDAAVREPGEGDEGRLRCWMTASSCGATTCRTGRTTSPARSPGSWPARPAGTSTSASACPPPATRSTTS